MKALDVSNIQDVLAELDTAQRTWAEKDRLLGGKAQEQFHKVCSALSEHDGMLNLIPNQNM